MPLFKWSKTAAPNATADPTVNWQEGMAPSSVNDSARAEMAAVKRWHDDITGTLVTTGSSTAYAVSTNSGFDSLANLAGSMVALVPHTTSGDSPTLNVDGLGAKPIRMAPGSAGSLPAGVLVAGTPYVATYYTTNGGEFILHGFYGNPYNVPVGGGMPFVGTTAPNSAFVFPFGQAISRSIYATLFAMVGTAYGAGDGSTTFNLPDFRGRVLAGKDDMGGASANRLTNQPGGLDGDVLGATGGGETRTLATANLPPYTPGGSVTIIDPGHAHQLRRFTVDANNGGANGMDFDNNPTLNRQTTTNTTGITATFSGNAQGGTSTPFGIVQPTIIVNYILRVI